MRIVSLFAIGLACSAFAVDDARADKAPVLVVPGRAGVPVVINGYDASYTVVEGDWGLARPGHRPPAIVSGPLLTPAPYYSGAYFPTQGRRPGYGRREVEPPPDRRLPRPAPSYHREWGVQSQQLPADVPLNPPPVIEASPSGSSQEDVGGPQDRRAGFDPDRQQDRRRERRDDRRDNRRDDRHHPKHHRKDRHHHQQQRKHR